MESELELIVERDDERAFLCSPAVGLFTCAVPKGRVLVPGEPAGTLKILGRALRLIVPAGCTGRVAGDRPGLVHRPVGYGERLYELEPITVEGAEALADGATSTSSDLILPAPHTGRFWHRPSAGDPPFVEPGSELEEGQPVGLIEVMKTFTRVHYHATGGLPPKGRVLRVVPADGEEVDEGDALLELEPS